MKNDEESSHPSRARIIDKAPTHIYGTIVHHGILDPGTPFIQKPFNTKDLAAKIKQVIRGGCGDHPDKR